jgi:PAS domain S-box-containing protein
MKIRQVLMGGVALTLALAVVDVALTQWYAQKITALNEVQQNASVVSRKVTALLGLGQEALLHSSPRVNRQWHLVQQDLAQKMQDLATQLGPAHDLAGLVAELNAVVVAFPAQFSVIVDSTSVLSPELANALRETLADQQAVEMQRVSDGVFSLAEHLAQESAVQRCHMVRLQWLLAGAFSLLALGGAVFVTRRLIKPIEVLKTTALQVQGGNMQARNHLPLTDEMGLLGATFDGMTATLQERERGLRQARHQATGLFDAMDKHSIVSIADHGGSITHANTAFCQISGYSREELLGQNHRILNSGQHPRAFWADFWGTLRSGKPWRGEVCNRAKDGSLYWVYSIVVPVPNEVGDIEQYVSIRNDITPRKTSEEALKNSEAVFSALFQSAAIGMALLTAKGRWQEVNPALCMYLGYTQDELKARTVADITHPEDRAFDAVQIPRLVAGEIPVYQRAKRYVHRDGNTLWGLVTASVARDTRGLPLFLIAQIVDITARKRAEDALQLSNALLEESQKIAKVGGWQLNAITGALYWTAQTYHIHETSPEEFDPTVDAGVDSFLPDSRERITQALEDALQRAVPYDLELQTHTTKGSLIHVRTTGTPRVVDGKVVELSGIFQDITQQKHYEASLQEARASAEQAAASKGQFLANMSHEIRTPMNAILGMLNLLQNTELTPRQRDYAAKTDGAAQSLLGLLNDILDFSKVEAGKMTLQLEPFRLDRLLRNLSVVLSANVGSKSIEVLYDIDPTVPDVLVGDALRLQQVLVNLGGNAVKFTAQGQVVLSLRKLSGTANTVRIEFAVQDSGIGIAPEHQAHIFTGFSQAEGSTTRRFGGTGLGLAICKRFVALMGSDIHLNSVLGRGSSFSFVLELPVVQDMPAELALPQQPSLAPQRVLVVDDNPIAAELLLKMVRSWGWVADWASSGAQALEMMAQAQAQAQSRGALVYPTVYMDWQMPQMDGWECTRRIRQFAAQNQLAQPTVIMVTAHGRETLTQRTDAEQDLLSGFLVKPVTASMLYDALMDACTGNSGLRQLAKGRSSARQLAGMRILMVEDNLINQQVAEDLLSAEGALVSLAANGRLGVEAVAAALPQFDVVLMDLQMPVLDGYGATRAIRQELGLAQLPIIAMTANAMASDRDACLAAGMNEHIGKPFDMAQLVSLLIRITGFAPPEMQAVRAVQEPNPTQAQSAAQAQPGVAGLDLAAALNRMSGKQALYTKAARIFSKSLATLVPALRAQLLGADSAAATMLLHTIKGNAGTLGATALASKAGALEALCHTPQGLQQCVQELDALADEVHSTQEKLGQALAQLEPALVPQPATPSAANKVAVLAGLRAVAELLAASDMAALQSFTQLREPLVQHFGSDCEPLDDALQNLDFETAHRLCMQLLGNQSP